MARQVSNAWLASWPAATCMFTHCAAVIIGLAGEPLALAGPVTLVPPPGGVMLPGWKTPETASLVGTLPSDAVLLGAGGAPEPSAGEDTGGGVPCVPAECLVPPVRSPETAPPERWSAANRALNPPGAMLAPTVPAAGAAGAAGGAAEGPGAGAAAGPPLPAKSPDRLGGGTAVGAAGVAAAGAGGGGAAAADPGATAALRLGGAADPGGCMMGGMFGPSGDGA